MSLSPSPPTELSARFVLAIEGLCQVLAVLAAKQPAVTEIVMQAWKRLRRNSAQFSALLGRFRAGTLRVVPFAPRRVGTRAPSPPKSVRLPRRFGWLFRMLPEVAGDGYYVASYRARLAPFRSQLRNLLSDPEMLALIEAAPQARRLLRSVCHLLAIAPTPALRRQQHADPAPAAPSAEEPAPSVPLGGSPPSIAVTTRGPDEARDGVAGVCSEPVFVPG
jgi:hypothetical protein